MRPSTAGSTTPGPKPKARKPNEWLIQEYRSGAKNQNSVFDVLCNRRAFAYDLEDLETAERRIRRSRRFTPEDRIVFSDWRGNKSTLRVR